MANRTNSKQLIDIFMKTLFIYKPTKFPMEHLVLYTHCLVCVGVANTIAVIPITYFQAELLDLCGADLVDGKQFEGYTERQIRIIGEKVLAQEGNEGFDLSETISNAIEELDEQIAKEQEENGRNGINQSSEYETIR